MVINSGRSRLAAYVALAYTLVIVYASVQPFSGWRIPPDAVFGFLSAAWPRYLTSGDIALNIAAYLPLGAMLVVALRRRCGAAAGCIAATLIAAALSLALESVQMFLPARIASNVDLLANSGGAALGAIAAWLFSFQAVSRHPLVALRRKIVRADMPGDCGLIMLAIWLFIQFDAAPLALASGDLREALALKPWFAYAPVSYHNVEMAVAALATLTLGLLAAQIATSRATATVVGLLALALTISAKTIAVWSLARAVNPLQWMTPGVIGGLLAGIALLAVLVWLPPLWRSVFAIAGIAAAAILVNVTPENPYQTAPPYLLALQPSHLSSFSNIVRVLSQLWPFTTVVLLLALAGKHSNTSHDSEGAA